MISVQSRQFQQIAVLGLGTSGLATARALLSGGAEVSVWDDDPNARKEALNENIALANPATIDWAKQDALVLSPGVPLTHPTPHPAAAAARASGKPVIGDIELLFENASGAKLVGVTGTNGKSTTSALIHHVLQFANITAQIGGNFGPPVLSLDPVLSTTTVVLELSSYQLDLIDKAAFDVAVFLNLTPDHLERHGDIDGYAKAKKRIFRNPRGAQQVAVIGVDDDYGMAIASELSEKDGWNVIRVSACQETPNGIHVIDGFLTDQEGKSFDVSAIGPLRGKHNWQNVAAAWAVARTYNITSEKIAASLKTFSGLPHRLETVAKINNIGFVNDSKATNVEATSHALALLDDIYWIAGGVAKEIQLATALPHLNHVRHAYLIGEAAEEIALELEKIRIPVTHSGDLYTALKEAHADAVVDDLPSPVVLLSPACASFDQFSNFEQRGDYFRRLVLSLAAGHET